VFHSAEPFFRPRTVAIVGASETGGGGWAKAIYQNLEYGDFPARTYLINPKRDELWGNKVYPDFKSIPDQIDLALTIVPAQYVPGVLEEGVSAGLKAALIYAARFGEGNDPEGKKRADAIKLLCDETGLVVCGPNCMGALSLHNKQLFYPATRVRSLSAGDTGVIFQSGGTFMFWLERASVRGLDFSFAVSSGNELNLDLADYINFLVDDAATKMIVCMVEGIRRPLAFKEAARRAFEAEKPILMVKVGRSAAGKEAAQSHTGALASDDLVLRAVCKQYGVTCCYSLDEMIEAALVFKQRRWPKGPRIAMAGYSGGGKGLFLDYAEDEGAVMATLSEETVAACETEIDEGLSGQNPIDCGAGIAFRQKAFSWLCQQVVADEGVDIMAIQGQLPTRDDDPANPIIFSDVFDATDKPTIAYTRVSQNVSDAGRRFQEASKMPFVQGLDSTIKALQHIVQYGAARDRGIETLPGSSEDIVSLEGDRLGRTLGEFGLTLPKSITASDVAGAVTGAEKIGFPVALKILSPEASHKTEVGGVSLNVQDPDGVRLAAQTMTANLFARSPGAQVQGFLVQEMVDGLEVIIGAREDPQFGPFMVVGFGGVTVEATQDVSLRMLPVDKDTAREMLDELRGKKLLDEFRGRSARDVEALVKAICGLSDLFASHRNQLVDFEINPLMVGAEGEGVKAVDVRFVEREE